MSCFVLFVLVYATLSLPYLEVQASSTSRFGCLNGEGDFVNWWFIYKQSDGLSYVYLDDTLTAPIPLSESKAINSPVDSPLVKTVKSANFPLSEVAVGATGRPFYVAWNDQQRKSNASANSSSNSKKAHSKGFLGVKALGRKVQSFFIQHTLPRFPVSTPSSTIFDSNVTSSAQHFLCLSMEDVCRDESGPEEMNFHRLLCNYSTVSRVAFFNYNYAWDKDDWLSLLMKRLIVNRPTSPSPISQFTIESTGPSEEAKLKLCVICKSCTYEADLYDDLTALLSIDHAAYGTDVAYGKDNDKASSTDNGKASSSSATNATATTATSTTALPIYNSLMIVQSYVDPSLLGLNEKIILENEENVIKSAVVQIANSNWVLLPQEMEKAQQEKGKISSAFKLHFEDGSDEEIDSEDDEDRLPADSGGVIDLTADATGSEVIDLISSSSEAEADDVVQPVTEPMSEDESKSGNSTSDTAMLADDDDYDQATLTDTSAAFFEEEFLNSIPDVTVFPSLARDESEVMEEAALFPVQPVTPAKPTKPAKDPYFLQEAVVRDLKSNFNGHKQACQPQLSLYKDHSKWSINIRTGNAGPFLPLLCFYDLNRTSKQARRGGAAFCLNSSVTGVNGAGLKLWSFFINLRPRPVDSAKFTNKSSLEAVNDLFGKTNNAFGERSLGDRRNSLLGDRRNSLGSSSLGDRLGSLGGDRRSSFGSIPATASASNQQKFILTFPLLSGENRKRSSSASLNVPELSQWLEFEGHEFLVGIKFKGNHLGRVPCPYKLADKETFVPKLEAKDAFQVARFMVRQGWAAVMRIAQRCSVLTATNATATATATDTNTATASSSSSVDSVQTPMKSDQDLKPLRYIPNDWQPCTVLKRSRRALRAEEEESKTSELSEEEFEDESIKRLMPQAETEATKIN